MPRGDKTGPNGQGPRTGRGKGRCTVKDVKNETPAKRNRKLTK